MHTYDRTYLRTHFVELLQRFKRCDYGKDRIVAGSPKFLCTYQIVNGKRCYDISVKGLAISCLMRDVERTCSDSGLSAQSHIDDVNKDPILFLQYRLTNNVSYSRDGDIGWNDIFTAFGYMSECNQKTLETFADTILMECSGTLLIDRILGCVTQMNSADLTIGDIFL